MSEEEKEFLRDATTPTVEVNWSKYLNSDEKLPTLSGQGRRGGGGMIIPNDVPEPDPLAEDWVFARIDSVLPDGRSAFSSEELERMGRILTFHGPVARARATAGQRGVTMFRKILLVFEGYGIKKIGVYDQIYDRVDIEITMPIAQLMVDFGLGLSPLDPPDDAGDIPEGTD